MTSRGDRIAVLHGGAEPRGLSLRVTRVDYSAIDSMSDLPRWVRGGNPRLGGGYRRRAVWCGLESTAGTLVLLCKLDGLDWILVGLYKALGYEQGWGPGFSRRWRLIVDVICIPVLSCLTSNR